MDDKERMVRLETKMEALADATKTNSEAIGGLTDALTELRITLSNNAGIIKSSFVFASIGTVLIGGLSSFFYWLFSVLHK